MSTEPWSQHKMHKAIPNNTGSQDERGDFERRQAKKTKSGIQNQVVLKSHMSESKNG